MYYLYRRLATRTILRGEANTITEAREFLSNDKHGFVVDENENTYNNIEELENAESVRSEPRTWEDYFDTGESEVSEDTDRELPESDQYRAE